MKEPDIRIVMVGTGQQGHIAIDDKTLCGEDNLFIECPNSHYATCKHCVRVAQRIERMTH